MKTKTTFGNLEVNDRFVILDMTDVDESIIWTKTGRVTNAKSEEGEGLALDESVTVRRV